VTSWSELKKVKSVNAASVNTGQVAGSSLDLRVLITINNKGTSGNSEARVSHLILASTCLVASGVSQSCGSTNFVQYSKESLG
jgi:hypothetical protein